jgi:ABC-2 type transport system ATP-binding protein
MDLSVETHELGRIYQIRGSKPGDLRQITALRDVSLQIERGELFGLLGPNGAGKTTLIKILTTLLSPTSGWAHVAGFDVDRAPEKVRPRINMVSGGEASGYGLLTVRENLWMFAQFYGIPSKAADRRITQLLEVVGLAERAGTRTSDLSTGLRQKMNIVRGFLTDPQVLFLDEPTLGLDVGASRDVRQFIRRWIAEDPARTLLLTTHFLLEAEELCDRVAIINQGRVLACDTPAALKRDLQRDAIFRIQLGSAEGLSLSAFDGMPGVIRMTRSGQDGRLTLEATLAEDAVLAGVIAALTAAGARMLNLEKREPSLEDVFIRLVGSSLGELEENGATES